jgi:NADPH:quinone reductase-like Zn-dependent oxidoreductase
VKAVVIHAPGDPDQLVMVELPEPIPGRGEVLVDVAFAGCNWADTQIRSASTRTPAATRSCWAWRFPEPCQSSDPASAV